MAVPMKALGGVVRCFATGELAVRRPGPIAIVNGRRRPGPDTPVAGVIGSTWPVTGRRRSEFTEGGRVREARDVFTTPESAPLVVADDVAQTSGDIITVAGRDYEVIEGHDWVEGDFGHYIAALIKRPEGV